MLPQNPSQINKTRFIAEMVFAWASLFLIFFYFISRYIPKDKIFILPGLFAVFLAVLVYRMYAVGRLLDRFNAERVREVMYVSRLLQEQLVSGKLLIRRDIELTEANEKLLSLDAMKSNFISVAAHQLRTPLSGIKWALNMMISGDVGALTDDQKTFLMKAYESNTRMINLVNDLLGIDRIESGRVTYNFIPTNLSALIDNVLLEILPQARRKGIKINFADTGKVLPMVLADQEKMREVIQNLIENAIRYTKEDGLITLSTLTKDDKLIFQVADNGIGIPASEQKNIFTRFFRSSNAIRVEADGSGLGLSISKSILDQHHGTISFVSEENKGTTFIVTLPIDQNNQKN